MNPSSKFLSAAIDECLLADRHRLRMRLRRLKGKPLDAIAAEIEVSRQKLAQRRCNLPRPTYPEELPVSERRAEILTAIQENQVVIVAGETGSGKTTQLPKICLDAGRGVAGLIGHTQPRRIAARSVAVRIASELQSELGHAVGYKVRFSDHTRPESYIKLMTDGILLAESQADRFLNQYDTLIIDEAHERSLNIDFLLGYLKQLLPKRPDLKLIITSATIDTERFSQHFAGAPIIEVSGRTYPVEIRYRPLQAEDEDEQDRDIQQAICDAADELARFGQGDVLIFLPGEREIRETAETLRKHHPPHTEILPLYARLSASDQNTIFQSHKGRRIVLSTNVAETSLTVPGIRYVIDPGLVRLSRYSHRTKVQRLPIEKISQASANQRAGRCGRVGPGVCIRLYSETEFQTRPEFTDPEIKRSNLASVILQMKSLRLGDIEDFPFVEVPENRLITDGYKLLEELGAVDARKQLTESGRHLAKLPLDPRVARMVLAGKDENSLSEMLIIASALSVQEPRERPHDKQQKADEKHKLFVDDKSDFIAYLNLWRAYHEQSKHLTNNKLRKWCRDNFISYMRLREWHDVQVQLKSVVRELGWQLNQQAADSDAVHRALLAGLLGNVANKNEKQEFTGARGIKLNIFPGSVLFKKAPKWIMAAELVETARMYARTVAKIEPEWIEKVAGDLCKRSYFDPHWEKKPAAVMAFERLTLYGLVVNPRRKIQYGRINSTEARELFIRGALVEGEFNTRAGFFEYNRKMIADIEALEAKSRRRDVLVDDQVLFDFYDKLIPEDICNGRSFEQWHKQAEKKQPKILYLQKDDLMLHQAGGVTEAQFPDSLKTEGMTLKLAYHFEPTHVEDGVTLTVPLPALNLLRPHYFEWLVPGLLHEKICQLLKSLPKSLRRNFVPVPNFADACLQALAPTDGSLLESLQKQLLRMTGVKVTSMDWDLSKLTPHVLMNFKVVDENGKTVAMGRDLLQLQQNLKDKAQQSFAAVPAWDGEREGMQRWDISELPVHIDFERNGVQMRGYPAMIDHKESVAIKLCDTPEQAESETRLAMRRLIMFAVPEKIKYLNKNMPGIKQMCLYYAPTGKCEQLKADLIDAVIDQAFLSEAELPRTQQQFEACAEKGKQVMLDVANELCGMVGKTLAEHHQLNKKLKANVSPAWLHALADIKVQLAALIYPGFIKQTPREWLREYPRYFKAINLRLERLSGAIDRDRAAVLEIQPLWQAYIERSGKHQQLGVDDPQLEKYRWMIEELRVSLFAQALGTKMPVSAKRLKQQLKQIR